MEIPDPLGRQCSTQRRCTRRRQFGSFYRSLVSPGVKRAARTADALDPIRSGKWISHLAKVYRDECEAGKASHSAFREARIDKTDAAAESLRSARLLKNAYHEDYDPWLRDVPTLTILSSTMFCPTGSCGGTQTWLNQIGEWVKNCSLKS